MEKKVKVIILVGVVISFISGFAADLIFIPKPGNLLVGNRAHLIGKWIGFTEDSDYNLEFFDNGSVQSKVDYSTFEVVGDRLIINSNDGPWIMHFFFIDDFNTLGIIIESNPPRTTAPFGLILQRA